MDALAAWIERIVTAWVGSLESSGYLGIFILMTIESSFLPLPSEIVMLPAGVLAREGKLSLTGIIVAGTAGSLAGALVNYILALAVGRSFLQRYGKYLLISEEHLHKVDRLWDRYGEVMTFVGRLLPVVRHLISIPAGFARMNLFRFCLWTTLGAALWVAILAVAGYLLGEKAKELWEEQKIPITLGLLVLSAVVIGVFLLRRWKKSVSAQPAEGT